MGDRERHDLSVAEPTDHDCLISSQMAREGNRGWGTPSSAAKIAGGCTNQTSGDVMVIEETFTINAPIQQVWEFFLDSERVSACMPGVENVRQTGPTTYEGSLRVKVGPIGAAFSGTAEVLEQIPPTFLRARGQARDRSTASLVQGEFVSTLTALGAQRTEVAYRMDLTIRGRLGQFGQAVIHDTARRLAAIFVEQVRAQLEVPAGPVVADADAPDPLATPSARANVNVALIALSALLAAIGRALVAPVRALMHRLRRKSSTASEG